MAELLGMLTGQLAGKTCAHDIIGSHHKMTKGLAISLRPKTKTTDLKFNVGLGAKRNQTKTKRMDEITDGSLAKQLCKVCSGFKVYSAVFIVAPPTTLKRSKFSEN